MSPLLRCVEAVDKANNKLEDDDERIGGNIVKRALEGPVRQPDEAGSPMSGGGHGRGGF